MRIMVVGLGHMGGAIVRGLLAKGVAAKDIAAVDVSDRAVSLATQLGVELHADPSHVQNTPQMVLLAVKPQMAADVLPVYQRFAAQGSVMVSIMAGKTLANMADLLGEDAALVRAMPNMPAGIGAGMTVLCANNKVTLKQKALAEDTLEATGATAWLEDEALMDAVTAVSGSGPAWFFLLTESLIDAGMAQGLPRELAEKLAVTTAWGSGELMKQKLGETSAAELRRMVASPGGTTEAGLKVFAEHNFHNVMEEVVKAAAERGKVLSG